MKIVTIKSLKLNHIPPWSLFIAHTDLERSGFGGMETNGKNCLGLQMDLHPANFYLADFSSSYVANFYTGYRDSGVNTAM